MRRGSVGVCSLLIALSIGAGRVLEVGPGRPFAQPSAALAAAHDGDTIRIDSAGNYANDVTLIDRDHLTVEGLGRNRAVLKTDGRTFGRKGIWVFADGRVGLTLRHLEFTGASLSESDGGNGAGLRSQGRDLTVQDCRFHHNQDGILGGFGRTTIEHCEFDHNGTSGLTHNLYIGDTTGTLVFRFNWSHDTAVGHLLKSRAAVNRIECNRLTDEGGTGSYELDLPNGGRSTIVGNIIQQSAGSLNSTLLCYGEEGVVAPDSALDVTNNTFVNDRAAGGVFIDAQRLPAGFRLAARNNLFTGRGEVVRMSGGQPILIGNTSAQTVAAAKFANPQGFDYRLQAESPAVGSGVAFDGPAAAVAEYVHPLGDRRRPDHHGHVDAGAFQSSR